MKSMMDNQGLRADEATRAERRAVRLPFGTKLAYVGGSALDAIVNTSANVFLLFYVTTACGLAAGMAGAAIALGLVIESVVDPVIGMASDNLRSRWGRRLPFMVVGLPVLLVSYVLLFSLPDTSNQWLLFAMVSCLSATVRISLSVFNLPYLAVGGELSDDQGERERIIALRWGIAIIAAFSTVAVGFNVYFSGTNGMANRGNYVPYAVTIAALMLFAGVWAIVAVRKTLDRQHIVELKAFTIDSILEEFRELLRSRSFRVLFGVALLFATAQGVTQSLGLHAYSFFWHLTAAQTQFVTLAMYGGLMGGALIAGPVIARMEYRAAALMGLAGLIVMQAVPPTLKLLGLLPSNPGTLASILVGFSLFGGAMTTIVAVAVMTMITNAVDEHEYLFGVRRESTYFAGWTLAFKVAGGLGTLFSGLALQAIDFPVQLIKEQGMNVVVPESTTTALGMYYGPGAAVLSISSLVLLSLFRLDRKGHRRIMAELESRRSGGSQGANC